MAEEKKIKLVESLSQFMQTLVKHYPAATIFTISCCIAFYYGYFEAFGMNFGGIASLEDILINSIYFAMTQFVLAILFVMMMAVHPFVIVMYVSAWMTDRKFKKRQRKDAISEEAFNQLSSEEQEGLKRKLAEEHRVLRGIMEKRARAIANVFRLLVILSVVVSILGIASQIFLLIRYWIPWARDGQSLWQSWSGIGYDFGLVLRRLIDSPHPFVGGAFWYDAFLLAVIGLSLASLVCIFLLLMLAAGKFLLFVGDQIHKGRGTPVFIIGGGLLILGYFGLGLAFGQDDTAAALRNAKVDTFEGVEPADFRKACLERGGEIWDGDKYRVLLCKGNLYKVRDDGPLILVGRETALRAYGTSQALPYTQTMALDFLGELYSHYDGHEHFSPLGEAAPRYFDKGLVALIREDDRLSNGEIGALDHDPVCLCQDYEAVVADMRVLSETASTMRIGVVLSDRTSLSLRNVIYDLVKVGGQWRIHDLSSSTMPSLRVHLTESNASLAKPSSATVE